MLLIFYNLLVLLTSNTYATANSNVWRAVETLAEEHPHVVLILNYEKEYLCTGAVIDERTILSSGSCVTPEPYYVAVGNAVFHPRANNTRMFKVAFAKLHEDYIFDFIERDNNISRMHSNIGLIFTVLPMLEQFFESATLSNFYASELKGKHLSMVGYGNMKTSESIVLQQQTFHQTACKNPKWYYCVCGIEYLPLTYEGSFGDGGPVFYGNEIVGIAASPTGTLSFRQNLNYNIFTVLGPYVAWIQKCKFESIVHFLATPNFPASSSYSINKNSSTVLLCLLISIIKICQ